jgi:hypothetical protein
MEENECIHVSENRFLIPIPGREKPVCVSFRPEGDAGAITVVGSAERLCGEWDLTSAGAAIFRVLQEGHALLDRGRGFAVMSTFQEQVVGLVRPMADEVDRCEREQEGGAA